MKDLRWPHVVVVLGALGVLGTLAFFDKDSAAVITGVLALLGVMGFVAYQQQEIKAHVETVKTNTNGNNAELMELVKKLQQENKELALRVPAPAPDSEASSVE